MASHDALEMTNQVQCVSNLETAPSTFKIANYGSRLRRACHCSHY